MAGGRGHSTRHIAVCRMHELDRVDRSGLGQLALVRVHAHRVVSAAQLVTQPSIAHHQLTSCPQLLAWICPDPELSSESKLTVVTAMLLYLAINSCDSWLMPPVC